MLIPGIKEEVEENIYVTDPNAISLNLPYPVKGLVHLDWNFSLKTINLASDSEHTTTHS